jgi:hypothetical protein
MSSLHSDELLDMSEPEKEKTFRKIFNEAAEKSDRPSTRRPTRAPAEYLMSVRLLGGIRRFNPDRLKSDLTGSNERRVRKAEMVFG